MPTLIERLRGKAQKQVLDAEAEYREIVKALANGKDYDDDRTDEVLRLTDRTVDHLERNVRTLRERIEARKVWDRWAKSAKQEFEKTQADDKRLREEKAKALADATAKINAAYDPKIAANVTRNNELQKVWEAASDAAVELTGHRPKGSPNHFPPPAPLMLTGMAIEHAERHPELLEPWPTCWDTLD